MVVGVYENHLSVLLKNFSTDMYLSYMSKFYTITSKSINDYAQDIEIVKNHDLAGDIAFRLSFKYPVYIMLSHPICRFSSRRQYPVREGSFIANRGLVPVFFPTLNIMTVLVLYNERTEGFFSPINSPLSDTGIVCWELPPSAKPAEYSTMNFILLNNSDVKVADRNLSEICEKYFIFSYWPSSTRGFVPSTHFLHSRQKITSIVKVIKSLYIIDEIGMKKNLNIEGHTIDCKEVYLRILTEHNGEYRFKNINALMDGELAEDFQKNRRVQNGFINAIVTELHYTGGKRSNLLNIIVDYGDSYFELLQCLIGIVTAKLYYNSSALSYICKIDTLREKVFDSYIDIIRDLKLPHTISDKIGKSFDLALQSLFQVIVIDNDNIYYVHPILLGFMKFWNLLIMKKESQNKILVHLLRLLDCTRNDRYMDIYLSEDIEFFKNIGISKTDFTKSLMRVGKMIKFAKMMDNTWNK
jgi:hypothetical protein